MDVAGIIKPLLLKDLRIQCRQRGLTPAGSREDLADRLKEHMLRTEDWSLRDENGDVIAGRDSQTEMTGPGNNYARPSGQNVGNFLGDRPSSRVLAAPGGNSNVNLGNMPAYQMPSSNVGQNRASTFKGTPSLAPVATSPAPPQKSNAFLDSMTAQIVGKAAMASPQQPARGPPQHEEPLSLHHSEAPSGAPAAQVHGQSNNNYHRPGGQNVGNYLTDRNSSRVLAPPGGASTLSLG